MNQFSKIFKDKKPIIGMVHIPPLPGAPLFNPPMTWDEIIKFTLLDAQALIEGGVDGIQIENQFDIPYNLSKNIGAETTAFMTAITCNIRFIYPEFPLGIHILLNGCIQALSVAKAAHADWIRAYNVANAYISNSGYIGASGPALMRFRNTINANNVMIFGDFQVKHGSHAITADRSIEDKAHDIETSLCDAAIVTGNATGSPPDISTLKKIREKISIPMLIGSGLSQKNIRKILPFADGAIVGTSLKKDGVISEHIDIQSVRELTKLAKSIE
jgi:membrane complex biogenesis BtpA family protein